ncbi:MAG: tetratricopeptide repeat protein [Alphaproteobacteria bacterium]|nr:tetratricopeptide repeat protein [Alphaproteobacteria bacterium]
MFYRGSSAIRNFRARAFFLAVLAVFLHAEFSTKSYAQPADGQVAPPEPVVAAPAASEQAAPEVDELLKKIEEGIPGADAPPAAPAPADAAGSEVPAGSPAVPQVINEAPEIPQPQQDGLASPQPEIPPVAAPVQDAAGHGTDAQDMGAPGEVPEQAVPEVPALPVDQTADENLFFDSDSLVPAGQMGSVAPRKVDPELEPASKLIIVKKNYGAGSRPAQLVAAQRAVQLGRYDSALRIYDELYKKDKNDPNVLLGRAVALQKLGQTDAAIGAYQQLLDIRPDNVDAKVNMLGLMSKRYPAVALRRLMDIREERPNDASVIAQIAVIHGEMGQYDEALEYLGMAASVEPNNAAHYYNMAVIADHAGKKPDAIRYYEQALETDTIYGGGHSVPRDSIYVRLAQLR